MARLSFGADRATELDDKLLQLEQELEDEQLELEKQNALPASSSSFLSRFSSRSSSNGDGTGTGKGSGSGSGKNFWRRRWLMKSSDDTPSCSSFATASTSTSFSSSKGDDGTTAVAAAPGGRMKATTMTGSVISLGEAVENNNKNNNNNSNEDPSVASTVSSFKSSSGKDKCNKKLNSSFKRKQNQKTKKKKVVRMDVVPERSPSNNGTSTYNTSNYTPSDAASTSTNTNTTITTNNAKDQSSVSSNNNNGNIDLPITNPNQVRVKIITSHEMINPAVLHAQEERAATALESCVVFGSDSEGEDDDDNMLGGHQKQDEIRNPSTGIFDFCGIILDIYHSSASQSKKNDGTSSSSLRRRRDQSPNVFHVGDVVIGTTRVPFPKENGEDVFVPFDRAVVNIQNIVKVSHKTAPFHQAPNPTIYCTVLEGFRQAGILRRLSANKNSGKEWYDIDYDEMSIAIVMNEEMQLQKQQKDLQFRSKGIRAAGTATTKNSPPTSASIAAIRLAQKLGIHRIVAVCGSQLDVLIAKQHGVTEIVHIVKKKHTKSSLSSNPRKRNFDLSAHTGEKPFNGGKDQEEDGTSFSPPKYVTFCKDTPGGTVTTIKQGGRIRVTNIPAGTPSTKVNLMTTTMKDWVESNQGSFDFIYKEDVGRSLWSTSSKKQCRQSVNLKPKQCLQLLKPENELGWTSSNVIPPPSAIADDDVDAATPCNTKAEKNRDNKVSSAVDDDGSSGGSSNDVMLSSDMMRSALIQGIWSKYEATAKVICYCLDNNTSSSGSRHRGRGGDDDDDDEGAKKNKMAGLKEITAEEGRGQRTSTIKKQKRRINGVDKMIFSNTEDLLELIRLQLL